MNIANAMIILIRHLYGDLSFRGHLPQFVRVEGADYIFRDSLGLSYRVDLILGSVEEGL